MTERPNWVGNTHSCRRWPAWPNGASNVKPSPAPNPSSEMEQLWTRTWDMAAPAGAQLQSVPVGEGLRIRVGRDLQRGVDVAVGLELNDVATGVGDLGL